MSDRRHRVLSTLATVTALVLAVPAFASSHHSPTTFRAGHIVRSPRAAPVLGRRRGYAGHRYNGRVAPARFHGRFGFHRYGGFGWGPYWGPFWDPFWYPDPWWYGEPYGPRGYVLQPAVPRDQSLVEFHIKPSKAMVTVDGKEIGRAKEFDTIRQPLWLKPGTHVIEIQRPGYQRLRLAIDVDGGQAYELNYALNRGQGLDNRSSQPGEKPAKIPTG
jgi:PEGA domain